GVPTAAQATCWYGGLGKDRPRAASLHTGVHDRMMRVGVAGGHERTDMEKALSRTGATLPGLVWAGLPRGRLDLLNHRWCAYTGLCREEACGWGWQTAIHPDDLPALLERWRAMVTAGAPGDMEARLRRVDGEYRWFLFRASPMADASGQVIKWCGIN